MVSRSSASAGLSGGTRDERTAALTGHTVVHLHGGLTPASHDGWAENFFAPGQPAVLHYPMNQRSALLWYRDHVMGITKYDVSGLAGLWIVRVALVGEQLSDLPLRVLARVPYEPGLS
jgi:hypothetical protein